MAPFSSDRIVRRPPRRAVASLACALLLAACAPAIASPPYGRLDPTERQRLREDLRRQYRDERAVQPGGGEMPAHPAQPLHRRGPPGYEPGPAYRGVPGYGDAPGYGDGAPGWGDGRRHRMSPEEREQLRHMLRERREAARRRGGWDGDAGR
jgi:uncharacterized membrane protein